MDSDRRLPVADRRIRSLRAALDALEQALHERRPFAKGDLVHHSDRGVQYLAIAYSERLADAGIEPEVVAGIRTSW